MLEAIKVEGRWRGFILNFIVHISSGLNSLILLEADGFSVHDDYVQTNKLLKFARKLVESLRVEVCW